MYTSKAMSVGIFLHEMIKLFCLCVLSCENSWMYSEFSRAGSILGSCCFVTRVVPVGFTVMVFVKLLVKVWMGVFLFFCLSVKENVVMILFLPILRGVFLGRLKLLPVPLPAEGYECDECDLCLLVNVWPLMFHDFT